MTLDQLARLYILQKNHYVYYDDMHHYEAFRKYYWELMKDIKVERSYRMASSIFDDQPEIPYTLFKPEVANPENPMPLIMHTHGGPSVYLAKDKLHAEIAYFLSKGYVVACPNYRGSTHYPGIGNDIDGWIKWEEKSLGLHHIYGPQDVYAVAEHMQKMSYIDAEKIFLRGGSYGSHINAHLLKGVKERRFDNIFKGAHFSGGVKYPPSTTMPDDIPLLITHAVDDRIACYHDAEIFMEKILLKQLSHELDGTLINQVETFTSMSGDHHLIDHDLRLEDVSSDSYVEMRRYLELTTSFIDNLVQGKRFQVTDSYDQLKKIITQSELRRPPRMLKVNAKDSDGISDEILKRVHAYKYITGLPVTSFAPKYKYPEEVEGEDDKEEIYGPSRALISLYNNHSCSGHKPPSLSAFLTLNFAPVSWDSVKEAKKSAGKNILESKSLYRQFKRMIQREERILKHNPDLMVMYHAADTQSLQLYCFINLWKNALRGKFIDELPVIEDMRLYSFIENSFDDVNKFLREMKKRKADPEEILNNIPGFKERAIACNPALISNAHSTASCSLWWYSKAKNTNRSPIEKVIADFQDMLGIYSGARLDRYIQLFQKMEKTFAVKRQALMQQIFIPYKQAEKSAYMCQVWGEDFNNREKSFRSPTLIKKLINDPVKFEYKLRRHRNEFTNFGNCPGFGETDKGFQYSGVLQLRYMPKENHDLAVFSYFRSSQEHAKFVMELSQLIREDYADYLAYGNRVPDSIVKGSEEVRDAMYRSCKLQFFQKNKRVGTEVFYAQQLELYRGLVENPVKEEYADIVSLSKEKKTMLQKKLKGSLVGEKPKYQFFTYSLCGYLSGYTYYDLLMEAGEAMLLNAESRKGDFDFYKNVISTLCCPVAVDSGIIDSLNYKRLYDIMHEKVKSYAYNSEKHSFFHDKGKVFRTDSIFQKELRVAIDTVMRYARMAKEKGDELLDSFCIKLK